MKLLAFCVAGVVGGATSVQAADLLSGTWTAGGGPTARTYIFKVFENRFTGIVCGPCDDPAAVFEIEDGQILAADKAVFFVRHDAGEPGSGRAPYRERVEATLAPGAVTLSSRRESDPRATPDATALTRVVANFEFTPRPLPPLALAAGAAAPSSFVEGHWVSVGNTAQQNWILKVRDGRVWGLVCGPCTPAVVAMIDGRISGDTVTFNINHIDTPPDPTRQGIQRNVMTGTLTGPPNPNVIRFKWVSESIPGRGGEIVMIGPIR
jgi:hypothetical protein